MSVSCINCLLLFHSGRRRRRRNREKSDRWRARGSMATDLDLKLFSTRTVCGLLKEATTIGAGAGTLARLEDSVRRLEEERRKIEAFKRELPFCMHLLTDVIEGLKKEMAQSRGEIFLLGFEEFMPKKGKFEEMGTTTAEPDCKDKMNWMSSVQLWSDSSSETKEDNEKEKRIPEEIITRVKPRPEKETLFLDSNSRNGSGAFVPFKGFSTISEEKPALLLPDLSRFPSPIKSAPRLVSAIAEDHPVGGATPKGVSRAPMSSLAAVGDHLSMQSQQQTQRKARRCWSPELHRRFVIALQHLGGAQVATPKQIRELMKMDGLTNDEVKSHLQKYRLHSRKVPNASSNVNLPVVTVEGLLTSQENYSSSSQQSISQSGSPQSPLHVVCSNQALSNTTGDSEEEDGRAESYNWK